MRASAYLLLPSLSCWLLAGAIPAQSPGFWEQRTSLNTPRQEVGAAVVNGLVYCAGGLGSNRAAVGTVERYDPKTTKWSFVASMPTTRHHFGMAAVGGKIYAIGGYISGFTGTNRCSVYDPQTNKWAAIANLPRARGALAAVAINGKIYAVGGVVPRVGTVGDLTVYDPKNNKWATLQSMPTRREHLGAAALGGKLYVAGGRRGGNFKILEVYNPSNNKWTTIDEVAYTLLFDKFGGKPRHDRSVGEEGLQVPDAQENHDHPHKPGAEPIMRYEDREPPYMLEFRET